MDTLHASVIAKNDLGNPVTIRMPWGKGNIILNTTPLAFTNIYALSGNNQAFLSATLSYLPIQPIVWTEYYQVGRMEIGSPLRFVLTNESLRWAYYISILSLLVFMVFEMKRRQRIIPVIKPLQNTTLEFVTTIGNLYYQRGDHKNMATKKIIFLLEQLRSKYMINTTTLSEEFITTIARKAAKPVEEVRDLVSTIQRIQSKEKISADELLDLTKKIEKFNQ